MEVWKDIKGFEGQYQISNTGKVRSIVFRNNTAERERIKILTPTDNGNGYLIVRLRGKNYYIHRLVASAFIDRDHDGLVVNHKDYNRKNNDVNNLEWITQKQNIEYSHERMKGPKKKPRKSNTGERYITYRKDKKLYRVTVNHKEIGTRKTIKEAIALRDAYLKGGD